MRFLKWTSLVFAILILTVGIIAMKHIPNYISGLLNDYFAKKLPNAKFEMGEVALKALRPGVFSITDIKYISSRTGTPELELEIKKLTVDLEVLPLMKGEFRIASIEIEGPKVVFRESKANAKAEKKSSAKSKILNFDLRGATFKDGELQYVRLAPGSVETKVVNDLNAEIGPLGQTLGNTVDIKIRGRIGKASDAEMRLRIPLFEMPLQLDADVRIRKAINVQRKADETIADFILRGLMDAGLDAAAGK